MVRREIEVFADYHQFYVWDGGVAPTAPEDFGDDDMRRMVMVVPNAIVVLPVRNTAVPVEIEVHAADPGCDESKWDHVVECSVDIPTGQLHVEACTTGTVLELEIAPGCYRARVLFGGLGTPSEDGLEGGDRYGIVLWPGSARPLRVIKQWANAEAGSS